MFGDRARAVGGGCVCGVLGCILGFVVIPMAGIGSLEFAIVGAFAGAVLGAVLGATYPDDAIDIEELLRRADESLYVAKQSGRNMSTMFKDSALRMVKKGA